MATFVLVPGYSHLAGSGRLDAEPLAQQSDGALLSGGAARGFALGLSTFKRKKPATPNPVVGKKVPAVKTAPSRGLPQPRLKSRERIAAYSPMGHRLLSRIDSLERIPGTDSYGLKYHGDTVYLTPVPKLQEEAEAILAKYRVPWGAIVAVDPKTGRVLTMASHSQVNPSGESIATRSGFPAASLFKIITAAAAVERAGLSGDSLIRYRGGRYTLNKYNYRPDSRRDRRSMRLSSAMGKSCNPAFGRVALQHLSNAILQQYAFNFGFNRPIPFELPLEKSLYHSPETDFELARTAAGFGDVLISPIHAALITAGLANEGVMMRPYIIDSVVNARGAVQYRSRPKQLQRMVLRSTSQEVLEMMQATVTEGTARKQFRRARSINLKKIKVAAKTGTLTGKNPQGVYHWFVAAAPMDDPEVAVAALVIDPGNARINGSGLGRLYMEHFFGG